MGSISLAGRELGADADHADFQPLRPHPAGQVGLGLAARVEDWFYEDGSSCGWSTVKYEPEFQGPFEKLVWRAKRQWRRWFPE